ncbi:uncharacterized protein LOC122838060 isoform X5 [Gambusia affinis]|uniref:uncharacterized protein LOC122838060 isoform X5 n=1 Tax=Gambusia affinis TaxID=33528 RepID=UPI001CDD05C1|nr:uncharacterized protein LOC122838060 isoform X5 [Gambusia affinis]
MSVAACEELPDRVLITGDRNSIPDDEMLNDVQIKEEEEETEPQQASDPNEEPEPQPEKVGHVEVWVFQDEQLLVQQETSVSTVTPAYGEKIHNEPEQLQIIKEETEPVEIKAEPEDFYNSQDEGLLDVKQEPETSMVTPTHDNIDPEPSPNQPDPLSSPEELNPQQQGGGQNTYCCDVCKKSFTARLQAAAGKMFLPNQSRRFKTSE